MDDAESLGCSGQGHVEVVHTLDGLRNDRARLDDEHRVELEPFCVLDRRHGHHIRRQVLQLGDEFGGNEHCAQAGTRVVGHSLLDRRHQICCGYALSPRLDAGAANGSRFGLLRIDRREHVVRHRHDLRRRSVVDRQFGELPALSHIRFEHRSPGRGSGRITGLRGVTHQCHPPIGDAPHHHSPCHRRQLLCLVHDHVPVGPGTVAGGAFGGGESLTRILASRKLIGVDQVVRHQNLRVQFVLEVLWSRPGQDVQCALGIGDLATPLTLSLFTFGSIVDAEQLGELVEQRGIRGREAVAAAQQRLALRLVERRCGRCDFLRRCEQVSKNLLGRQIRPQLVYRSHHVVVLAHLVPHVRNVVGAEQARSVHHVLAEFRGQLIGQLVDDRGHEQRPSQVVWSPGGPGAAAGTRDYLSIEGDVVGIELQPARLCGHLLAITHCLCQYVDHRQSALDLGG